MGLLAQELCGSDTGLLGFEAPLHSIWNKRASTHTDCQAFVSSHKSFLVLLHSMGGIICQAFQDVAFLALVLEPRVGILGRTERDLQHQKKLARRAS